MIMWSQPTQGPPRRSTTTEQLLPGQITNIGNNSPPSRTSSLGELGDELMGGMRIGEVIISIFRHE